MSPPTAKVTVTLADVAVELLGVLAHEVEAGLYDDTIAELRAARTLEERREILKTTLGVVTLEAERAFSEMQKRATARKG